MEDYSDYKILICQVCGEKEMVPERMLESDENIDYEAENSAANDGGFDRDVGSDCDSGLCPVR